MYERDLIEAELILRTQKEPLVPVRKVWEEVSRRLKAKGFEVAAMPDFSAMLEGDRRFQIIPAQNKIEEDREVPVDDASVDLEMENLGFYSEDQVRLRTARAIEPEIAEDEEEVGSIRRRAFVSRQIETKKILVKKKGRTRVSLKSAKQGKSKKALSQSLQTLKQKSSARNIKTKTRLRRKK